MIRGRSAFAGVAFACAVLAGCAAPKVHQVRMDGARVAPLPVSLRVACAYRLDGVEDARETDTAAGGLGTHAFTFPDAADVLRGQLREVGVSEHEGTPVRVRILHLYLAQNTVTKVPVAVYQLRIGDDTPVLLRAQPTSGNWAGTQNEAYRAYAAAMQEAMRQVVVQLNAGCGASPKA